MYMYNFVALLHLSRSARGSTRASAHVGLHVVTTLRLPVELLEQVLLKSFKLMTRDVWEMTSQPHHVVYQSLTSVSNTWHHVITDRPHWFTRQLNNKFTSHLSQFRKH